MMLFFYTGQMATSLNNFCSLLQGFINPNVVFCSSTSMQSPAILSMRCHYGEEE